MNTEHLRYFIATVETGSYAAAGRLLYVSPEGVAKAVRRLENDYGVSLIEKNGRNIQLTEAGRVVYAKSKNLTDGLIDLREWSQAKTDTAENKNVKPDQLAQ